MSSNNKTVNLNITFKNTEATEPIRNYTKEKLEHCLKKFIHHSTEAHVVLKVEKNRQSAEISFHVDGADFNAKEESSDLYKAIDALVETMTHQLRKHKEKLTEHH